MLRNPCKIMILAALLAAPSVHAQVGDRYLIGEEKKFQIRVNILGQVLRPGEYLVADDTDVLGLLAKAGGPTELASLDQVQITHTLVDSLNAGEPRVTLINLDEYLASPKPSTLPALHPGDVVMVPRNSIYTWRFVAAILRDLSVVASAYFLGVRAFND